MELWLHPQRYLGLRLNTNSIKAFSLDSLGNTIHPIETVFGIAQVMDSLYILKITMGVLVELWRENQIVYRLTFFFLTGLLLELWFFWGMVHLYKNQKGIDLEILKENLMVFL